MEVLQCFLTFKHVFKDKNKSFEKNFQFKVDAAG